MSNFHSKTEYLIYIQEFPNIYFTELTGGERTNEVTKITPGGLLPGHKNVYGPTKIGDITLTKPFDSVADQGLVAWDRAWTLGVKKTLTIVKQPINAAGSPQGPPETWLMCGRVSFTPSDVSKESAEAANITLVLAPEVYQ